LLVADGVVAVRKDRHKQTFDFVSLTNDCSDLMFIGPCIIAIVDE